MRQYQQYQQRRASGRALIVIGLLAVVASLSARAVSAAPLQAESSRAVASATHSAVGALDLCKATYQAVAAAGGVAVSAAPPAWVVLGALGAAGCGAAIGAYLGHLAAPTICWLSTKPAWMGGGAARWLISQITGGRTDHC